MHRPLFTAAALTGLLLTSSYASVSAASEVTDALNRPGFSGDYLA